MIAAANDNFSCLSALLDASSNEQINLQSQKFGWTSLHFAAKYNSYYCICLLILRGADVESKDNDGNTVFDIAGQYGPKFKIDLTRQVISSAMEALKKDKIFLKGSAVVLKEREELSQAHSRLQKEKDKIILEKRSTFPSAAEELVEKLIDVGMLSSDRDFRLKLVINTQKEGKISNQEHLIIDAKLTSINQPHNTKKNTYETFNVKVKLSINETTLQHEYAMLKHLNEHCPGFFVKPIGETWNCRDIDNIAKYDKFKVALVLELGIADVQTLNFKHLENGARSDLGCRLIVCVINAHKYGVVLIDLKWANVVRFTHMDEDAHLEVYRIIDLDKYVVFICISNLTPLFYSFSSTLFPYYKAL